MDDALLKPVKVKCSVKIGSPWVWDEEWQDYVEKEPDVSAVGSLVEVKDPKALRAREFRADMVHGPGASNEDIIMCDLAPTLEAVLNGTDATLLVAGVEGGAQAELMDGAEGLAAAAVWQLSQELHERQANHRSNGAVGYSYHMRLQAFQLNGDAIVDLLTDAPDAARLVELPKGVQAQNVRTASATSADEFMKYVEGAQRRREPSSRKQSSTFYIIEVTQADYYEGWGLHGRFCLVESAVMDCLAEDKGLVQLREGYDRYRAVYHLRSLAKSWRAVPEEPVAVNGSALTWLLREVFTGGSVEAHVLFVLGQGKPLVSVALMELMEDLGKVHTNPVTQDHRVAGWARAMRAERLCLKVGERLGVDQDTRSLILELEKRLANAERVKEEAQRVADARQERAHGFQDKYVAALEHQESMNEALIRTEEEQVSAMRALVESEMETSEVKDEFSEMQYTDNVLLMMLEQEVSELREKEEAASKQVGDLSGKQAKDLVTEQKAVQDLRARNDGLTEAKMQAETQREVERVDLENKVNELKLELREGRFKDSVQHTEEKVKISQGMQEELERLRQVAEDERSRARRVVDDGEALLRHKVRSQMEHIEAEQQEEKQMAERRWRSETEELRTVAEQSERSLEHERLEMQREEAVLRSLREEVLTWRRSAEEAREERLQGKGALDEAKARAQAAEEKLSKAAEPGRLSQIQDRLLEEVQSLRSAQVAPSLDLQEQNRSLQTRLQALEQQSPPDRRAQAQRLAFLEKSVRGLEQERSELLVRATVAEEQLKQLQKHLKEMTEDYQMQILNLKLKAKG